LDKKIIGVEIKGKFKDRVYSYFIKAKEKNEDFTLSRFIREALKEFMDNHIIK
jgi:hypothetical protein